MEVQLFNYFQALSKLLQDDNEDVSGQIFYLTDDCPKNLFFFLDPLYKKLNTKAKNCPSAFHVPQFVTSFISLIFHGLSIIIGPKFRLPFWGFTFMESYKVRIQKYTQYFM